MQVAIPNSRPKLTREEAEKILKHFKIDFSTYKVIIIGIRGYYANSIGLPGKNDRGVYDDAMFIITPDFFKSFNANCDPSSYRKGYGFEDNKGMASLKANLVYFSWKLDYHKGKYLALCQRVGPMTVIRDGVNGDYEHTSAWIGCNNHKGGINTTASLCCQTVPPQQWDEYIEDVSREMKKYYGADFMKKCVPYAFVDEMYRKINVV